MPQSNSLLSLVRKYKFLVLGLLALVILSVILVVNWMYLSKTSVDKDVYVGDYTPYSVKFTSIGRDSFTIEWKTKKSTIGYIKYGFDPQNIDIIEQGSNEGFRKHHKVTVKDLEPGQTYFVEVYSNGQAFGMDGKSLKVSLLK